MIGARYLYKCFTFSNKIDASVIYVKVLSMQSKGPSWKILSFCGKMCAYVVVIKTIRGKFCTNLQVNSKLLCRTVDGQMLYKKRDERFVSLEKWQQLQNNPMEYMKISYKLTDWVELRK